MSKINRLISSLLEFTNKTWRHWSRERNHQKTEYLWRDIMLESAKRILSFDDALMNIIICKIKYWNQQLTPLMPLIDWLVDWLIDWLMTASIVTKADLHLTLQPRTLNIWSSCLHFSSAEIVAICHYTWFM